MNLVADESVDQPIVDRLRADGHDVVAIAEISPSIPDDDVLDAANSRSSILLTADKDFGELVYRLNRVHFGVILIRLAGLTVEAKSAAIAQVLKDHPTELTGSFCVVTPGAVRIRFPS